VQAQSEKPVADEAPAVVRPIEFVTENGFSILRPWETERVSPPPMGSFGFIVRDLHGQDQEVVVEIADSALRQLSLWLRQRIISNGSFWICCAEAHLATYLWEKGSCPAGNKLVVHYLDPEELILAIRWCQKLARSNRGEVD
jgi:hypothetical protein